jgi:hypothetical protein
MIIRNDVILDATLSNIPNPQGIITGTWAYTDEQEPTECGYTGITAGQFSIYGPNYGEPDPNIPTVVDPAFFIDQPAGSAPPEGNGGFTFECSVISDTGVDYTRDFATLTNFWGQCTGEESPVRGTVALTFGDRTMTFQIYKVIDAGSDRFCVNGYYIQGDTTIVAADITKATIQIVKMAFTFRGDWELGGSYTYNDIVNYDGQQWVLSSDIEMTDSPDSPDTDSAWTLYSPVPV